MSLARKNAGIQLDRRSRADIRATMRDLKRLEPDTAKVVRSEFRALARSVAMDARKRAPKKTGALSRSIKPRVSSRGDASIFSGDPAAKPNEFGGRHPLFGNRDHWYPNPKRPFMFPAVEANSRKFFIAAEAALAVSAKKQGFK